MGNYSNQPRARFMQDFERFLFHTLSTFQGSELLKFRGYACHDEFVRCSCGPAAALRSSVFREDPCLDEEAKLEILERRLRSLEYLFYEPSQTSEAKQAKLRPKSAKGSGRTKPQPS